MSLLMCVPVCVCVRITDAVGEHICLNICAAGIGISHTQTVCGRIWAYLLSAGHPAADGRHQDGAEQDLSRMVDQQRDRDQRQMLIARKHDL